MSKLNQFQKGVLRDALKMYAEDQKQAIRDVISSGKTPIITEGFVDMQINELLDTLKIVKG